MPTSSGEEVSTGELKNVLKEIVDGEDKRKPYTDDELVELMNKKGTRLPAGRLQSIVSCWIFRWPDFVGKFSVEEGISLCKRDENR